MVVASSFCLYFASIPPSTSLELSSSNVDNPSSSLVSLSSPFVVARRAGHKPPSAFNAPIDGWLLCRLLPLCLPLHRPPSAFVIPAIVQLSTLLLPAAVPMSPAACASASCHTTSCWLLSSGESIFLRKNQVACCWSCALVFTTREPPYTDLGYKVLRAGYWEGRGVCWW